MILFDIIILTVIILFVLFASVILYENRKLSVIIKRFIEEREKVGKKTLDIYETLKIVQELCFVLSQNIKYLKQLSEPPEEMGEQTLIIEEEPEPAFKTELSRMENQSIQERRDSMGG